MSDAHTATRRGPRLAAGSPAAVSMVTELLQSGTMTRVELGERTGFSAGAVTKALRPLLDAGLVRELRRTADRSGAGRPALPVEVDPDHAYLVGVKLTADEVIAVLTDLRAQVRDQLHLPLPVIVAPGGHAHTVDPEVAIAAVAEAVRSLARTRDGRVAGVGVAVSGDVDTRTGVVRFSPLLGWSGVPLGERLAAATGLPTVVENDVRALTVAEQWFGSGVGARSFALVTVGTGVGCGLVVDGRLLEGAYGVAGELGHLSVDPSGPVCHCGATGCVEAIVGEAALLDRVASVTSAPVADLHGARLAADTSDAVRAVFADTGRVLGLALAAVVNLIGPRRVVLTGELLECHDLFAPAMHDAFARQAFGAARGCEIVVRPRSFEQWARGAVAVALADLVRG